MSVCARQVARSTFRRADRITRYCDQFPSVVFCYGVKTLRCAREALCMDAHEELLDKWAQELHHRGRCFIKDGIIDQKLWESTTPRVLFLLKEARHDEPVSAMICGNSSDGRRHTVKLSRTPPIGPTQSITSLAARFPGSRLKNVDRQGNRTLFVQCGREHQEEWRNATLRSR